MEKQRIEKADMHLNPFFQHSAYVTTTLEQASAHSPAWSLVPFEKKYCYIKRCRDLLSIHASQLITLLQSVSSQSQFEAEMEFNALLSHFDRTLLFDEQVIKSSELHQQRQCIPVGTIACIGTSDFPILTVMHLVPLFLLTGNTCIIKPAAHGEKLFQAIVSILYRAGLPQGVVQLLLGDRITIEMLIRSQHTRAILSVSTANAFCEHLQLAHLCGKRILQVMYPWAVNVVASDADIDQLTEHLMTTLFWTTTQGEILKVGQFPLVIIVESVAQQFLQKLKNRLSTLRVNMAHAYQKHHHDFMYDQQIGLSVEQAITAGAQQVRFASHTGLTMLDNLQLTMSICKEDTVGPFLGIIRVKCLAEVHLMFEKFLAVKDLESAHHLRAAQLTCAMYTADEDLGHHFLESFPAVISALNKPPTTGFLMQWMGNAQVLDTECNSSFKLALECFTQTKIIKN